uniref:Isopropylmalate dehydrogenase-like domain-containing protein n=1 Tax=Pavo cristatus TaxID=9049 RepID=A0A8C9LE77_PAVCR
GREVRKKSQEPHGACAASFQPPALRSDFSNFTRGFDGPPPAKYGGRHTVTLIPGDGIGPELMLHVKEVFRHACVPVDFEEVKVGAEAPEDEVHNAIMAIRRNGVALKGTRGGCSVGWGSGWGP